MTFTIEKDANIQGRQLQWKGTVVHEKNKFEECVYFLSLSYAVMLALTASL